MNKKTYILVLVIALFISFQQNLFSQTPQGNLSDNEVRQRLAYIESSLRGGQTCANGWYWSWMGIYGTATTVQLALFFAAEDVEPDETEHFKQDMMAGAITSVLGIVGLAIDPMVPGYALGNFENMAAGTPEERLARLEQAEYWMRRSALREEDGRSWISHSLNFAVNLAAGLTIWLAFDRTIVDGLIAFLPGLAVGELQIWTQPTRAIDDWERYEQRFLANSYGPHQEIESEWFVSPYPGGFIAGLRF